MHPKYVVSLILIGCMLARCSLILDGPHYISRPDGGDVGGHSDAHADVHSEASDTGVDVQVTPDAGVDVMEARVDALDTHPEFDARPDATNPDVNLPDVNLPDVSLPDVVTRPDVHVTRDSGPVAIMRYEFRILDSADPSATDPMHLKIFDTVGGAGWLQVNCLNTGSTTMALMPGTPGGFRGCETDVRYTRFVFDYQSTLTGPNTNTVGGAGCHVRDGFEARIFDLRISATVPIADQTTLTYDCTGVYWVHVLL